MKWVFQLFQRLPKFKFLSSLLIFTPLTFLSFISCSVESKTSESQPPKSETPEPKLEEAKKIEETLPLVKLEEAQKTEEPMKHPEKEKEVVRYWYSSAYARDWMDKTFPEIEEVVKSFPPYRKLTDEEKEVYVDKQAEYLKKMLPYWAELLRKERMKEEEMQ